MNKRKFAVLFVVVGVIIYFFPQISQVTQDKSQLTGAIFAVAGAILWYLPGSDSQRSKSKKK